MKREWKKEINAAADIKVKEDESRLGAVFNPDRHIVVEMANTELKERKMAQSGETYRLSRQGTINNETYVSPETLSNREKRAQVRALKRRTRAETSEDSEDNEKPEKTRKTISIS